MILAIFWTAFGWAAGVVARPMAHGNNVDDLVCLVLPMIILGVVFLIAMRKGNAAEPDGAEGDEPAPVEGDGDGPGGPAA